MNKVTEMDGNAWRGVQRRNTSDEFKRNKFSGPNIKRNKFSGPNSVINSVGRISSVINSVGQYLVRVPC